MHRSYRRGDKVAALLLTGDMITGTVETASATRAYILWDDTGKKSWLGNKFLSPYTEPEKTNAPQKD